tara:strand:- start:1715 stop:1825 length:111 start_codon:yes stop_codon:yes gene_type:complete
MIFFFVVAPIASIAIRDSRLARARARVRLSRRASDG